jgi:hypothetical protein
MRVSVQVQLQLYLIVKVLKLCLKSSSKKYITFPTICQYALKEIINIWLYFHYIRLLLIIIAELVFLMVVVLVVMMVVAIQRPHSDPGYQTYCPRLLIA